MFDSNHFQAFALPVSVIITAIPAGTGNIPAGISNIPAGTDNIPVGKSNMSFPEIA